jgi:RNA polymerase sigma-70 factor (ECF subfamily)
MKSRTTVLEDSALIALTLAGQKECFDVLIQRHQSAVRGRIRSMKSNAADEDDLVQNVFFKAWRHLASFRSEAKFSTWLTRIATNEVIQLYRRQSHSPLCAAPASLHRFASKLESPHQCLEREQAARRVRGAIARLPVVYKQILTLRDLNQISEEDTARWMRGSVSMVKTRLYRARRMLSEALHNQSRKELSGSRAA